MTPDLLTIPTETPRWKELASLHGIIHDTDPATGIANARISWFGVVEAEIADTEKEAVVALIHKLQLTGWDTISLNP